MDGGRGILLVGEATREAPAQAELRPACAGLPARRCELPTLFEGLDPGGREHQNDQDTLSNLL